MRFKVLFLLGFLVACDDGEGGAAADAGRVDGGQPDARTPDAALPDAAPVVDAGPDAAPSVEPIRWPAPGPLAAPAGRGSFRFGAATAAAQIEDGLTANDWYVWTLPAEEGGLGKGRGLRGRRRAVHPRRRGRPPGRRHEPGRLPLLHRLVARGQARDRSTRPPWPATTGSSFLTTAGVRPIDPRCTASSPLWARDLRVDDCPISVTPCPPTRTPLRLGHPVGARCWWAELAEHAALLARRYGDQVLTGRP
ncbi:MAG: hypothetical protein R3F43_25430 [bacterium]